MLKVSGGNSGGVTPVPIPNTEVKPSSADGTAREAVWESRTLPEFFQSPARVNWRGSFFWVLKLEIGHADREDAWLASRPRLQALP